MGQKTDMVIFSKPAGEFLQAVNALTKATAMSTDLTMLEIAGVLQQAANRAFFVCTPEFDRTYPEDGDTNGN